MKTPILQSFI